MARAKTQTVEVVVLDEEFEQKFDQYLKQSKAAARGRRATKQAQALRDEIVEAMNGATLAALPDGRQIQRVHQSVFYPAKKAATIKWDELNELHPAE